MSKKLRTISAADRASEFKEDMYADGGVLFCKFCKQSIEHERVHTIKMHLKSAKHDSNKKNAQKPGTQVASSRQSSIEGAMAQAETASNLRSEFNEDLLSAFAIANIPVEKAPLLCPFLLKHCKQGGSCHGTAEGLCYYASDIYDNHQQHIKQILTKKCLALIVDETTDASSRSVLNIIALILEPVPEGSPGSKPLLINTIVLEACNSTTVGQAILTTIIEYGISYNNIRLLMTDNARYMKKCSQEVLSPVLPNMVHGTCWAHILS